MKLVVFDGFDGDCCGGAENGFDTGGAGDLRGGAGKSEDELAVVLSACEVLQEFC